MSVFLKIFHFLTFFALIFFNKNLLQIATYCLLTRELVTDSPKFNPFIHQKCYVNLDIDMDVSLYRGR